MQKLQLVRNNAEYLLRLIGQILDLSKLEARRMELRAAPDDLVQCVEQSVAAFAPAAEAKGITLTLQSPPAAGADQDRDTWFDRDVVEKILNNVIGNALKFTPNGGTVSVALTQGIDAASGGEFAELLVSDTGVGIPQDRLPQSSTASIRSTARGRAKASALVWPWSRSSWSCTTAESRSTAWMAKGRLSPSAWPPASRISSRPRSPPHRSSPARRPIETIMVRARSPEEIRVAPLEAIELPVAEPASDMEEETAVLVVEDNARVRVVVREQLQPYYRVLEAGNGAKGFDLAVSSLPDLVLSDVLMPEMNGYELCRALKGDKRTCHIPVVLLTARAGRDDRLHGLDTGADSYLVKPFDSSEMLVQVRNLIEQRRRLRERFSAPIVLKPSEMGVMPMDEAFLQKVLAVVQANFVRARLRRSQPGPGGRAQPIAAASEAAGAHQPVADAADPLDSPAASRGTAAAEERIGRGDRLHGRVQQPGVLCQVLPRRAGVLAEGIRAGPVLPAGGIRPGRAHAMTRAAIATAARGFGVAALIPQPSGKRS